MHLETLLRLPMTGRGPGYTCGMLAREMSHAGLDVTIVAPRARNVAASPAQVVQALPLWARAIPYGVGPWMNTYAIDQVERVFMKRMLSIDGVDNSAAYIFPDASIGVLEQLRSHGFPIVREMIGCHRGTFKRVFDEAYERLGLPPGHGVTAASALAEQEALDLEDWIFCPNAMVEASLAEHGVDAGKMMNTSYGWDPARFTGNGRLLGPIDGLTVLFVGNVSIEKGAHLLLDYWVRSGIAGRLVLAGKLHPAIEQLCGDLLSRPDVVLLGYVEDLGDVYRSADVLAFPTLGEGGPQVTYEACGCGLPVITTPMGAGRVVRNGIEGFVLDPYDGDAWISALRELDSDKDKRLSMAGAAAAHADEFVWSRVAEKRARQITERLG